MKARRRAGALGSRGLLLALLLGVGLRAAPANAQLLQQPYVELGGNGLLGSVGYELQPLPRLGVRAGFTAFPLFRSLLVVTPLAASYWVGGGSHHFEFGAGATVAWIADNDARFWTASAGYRYQCPEGGVVVRAFATAFVRMNDSADVLLWPGVSIGHAF